MFAVIKTGGKQYKVQKDNIIKVERIEGEVGQIIDFNEVLMIGSEPTILGEPLVKGALVKGEIISQERDDKIIIFKKRRRRNFRSKNGHRQYVSFIKISEISKVK